jgi:hypothetical protein
VRAGLALAVIVLNVLALVSILGARTAASRRMAWAAAVLLLPLLGALAWLAAGRRHGAPAAGGGTGEWRTKR